MELVGSFRVIDLFAGSSWEPRSEHTPFSRVQPWNLPRFRKSFSLGRLPVDRSFNSASIGNTLSSVASHWKELSMKRCRIWEPMVAKIPDVMKIMIFQAALTSKTRFSTRAFALPGNVQNIMIDS